MNTMDALFSRKSVRSYTGEPATEEMIQTMLKAACAAPVGMGKYENIHLTVITDKDLLHEIDRAGAEMFGDPARTPLYGAPVMIAVSTKLSGTPQDNVPYSNVAMIVHNMALAATDMGIGSVCIWGCIRALNNRPDLVEKLNLPEGFTVTGSIVFGPTTEKMEKREVLVDRIETNYVK